VLLTQALPKTCLLKNDQSQPNLLSPGSGRSVCKTNPWHRWDLELTACTTFSCPDTESCDQFYVQLSRKAEQV
jgi:hypothetical protein